MNEACTHPESSLLDPISILVQVHVPVRRKIRNVRIKHAWNTHRSIIKEDKRRAVGLANPLPIHY